MWQAKALSNAKDSDFLREEVQEALEKMCAQLGDVGAAVDDAVRALSAGPAAPAD